MTFWLEIGLHVIKECFVFERTEYELSPVDSEARQGILSIAGVWRIYSNLGWSLSDHRCKLGKEMGLCL